MMFCLQVQEAIATQFENNNNDILAYLDVLKALDSVWKDGLFF